MPHPTLEQAVRNAVAAEESSAAFYQRLSQITDDERAREFFLLMADQEREHGRSVAEIGRRLGAGELPVRADHFHTGIEKVPGWERECEISFSQALQLAREAEENAASVYEALADQFEGPTAELFATIARAEEQHAQRLDQIRERAKQEVLARRLKTAGPVC